MYQIDTQEDAESYANRAREILPTDYNAKKVLAARRKRFTEFDIDDDIPIDENKIHIQQAIIDQLNEMNGLFFDLTEEEVNHIQDLLDFEYADESDDDQRTNGAMGESTEFKNEEGAKTFEEEEETGERTNSAIEEKTGESEMEHVNQDGRIDFLNEFVRYFTYCFGYFYRYKKWRKLTRRW